LRAAPSRSLTAIVRPPSAALARCELTHLAREVIDLSRAQAQHAAYRALLGALGADVEVLPPEPDLPDAVFVEDVAVVLDELAVLTNPGAKSRRAEVAAVAAALERHRPVHHMPPPATLDGGDVVVVDREIYVGRSTRTNPAGIAWLRDLLAPLGYRVAGVAVGACLHLKSACTYLGNGVLVANPDWVDIGAFGGLEIVPVSAAEPRAANTFRVGEAVVMAEGFPQTRARIEARGCGVHAVDLSELQKAEAAGSCMSLVFNRGELAPAGIRVGSAKR
jgi:dimethylargininase